MAFSKFQQFLNKQVVSCAVVVVVTVAALLPFVNKAYHIDDTLFLASAKQIEKSPLDFYGFSMNWYGIEKPMSEITKNPPLTSYYIALVGRLFGYKEVIMHIAFLLPAVAVGLGTYFLAVKLCMRPVLAAIGAVVTPGFLVSSSNVMCDTMMLALWMWAIVLWMRGISEKKVWSLFASAILISLCVMTKYFGITLILLLLVYSISKNRSLGLWALFLLIPIFVLVGYQWMTHVAYGKGLLLDAVSYATERSWKLNLDLFLRGLITLFFLGGCFITVLFYIPFLWPRRGGVLYLLLAALFLFSLNFVPLRQSFTGNDSYSINLNFILHRGLMALSGIFVLVVCVIDLCRSKQAESLLILLWIFGTFIFTAFVNWTVNARSILPMIPAASILLFRYLDRRYAPQEGIINWKVVLPLIPAALISFLVCIGDYNLAGSSRAASAMIHEKFKDKQSTVLFQGHWGFQYYMESHNAIAFDAKASKPRSGDVIITPLNNANPILLPHRFFVESDSIELPSFGLVSIMNSMQGAGFYSARWGPLPFICGKVPKEKYLIYTVK